MRVIKLYGERNTGTNYLLTLMTKNIVATQLRGTVPKRRIFTFSEKTKNIYFSLTDKKNLGWKHSKVDLNLVKNHSEIDNICFITLTKNPYSFLLSLYKRPYHWIGPRPFSFSEFIRSKWIVQKRDKSGIKYYDNPIHLWNDKNKSYINLKENVQDQCYNMTYESLLANYESQLSKIIDQFNLEKINDQYENEENSTKDKNESHSSYKEYYNNELWVEKLCKEDIEYINEHLNNETLAFFGYNKK